MACQIEKVQVSIYIIAMNWEIYAKLWENLALSGIGKEPVFDPKYDLGKSLVDLSDHGPIILCRFLLFSGQVSLSWSMALRTVRKNCIHDHGSCKRGGGMSELVVDP